MLNNWEVGDQASLPVPEDEATTEQDGEESNPDTSGDRSNTPPNKSASLKKKKKIKLL